MRHKTCWVDEVDAEILVPEPPAIAVNMALEKADVTLPPEVSQCI